MDFYFLINCSTSLYNRPLEKTIREQSRLISTLRQQNKALTISYRENPPQHIRPIIKQPPKDHFADFVDTARTQKFCFVGGTEKWQTKINKNIPGAYCINTINFDDSLIREADILVINTTFTGHALTARAKQIATAANKQVLYTSKVNLNNMAKELLRGLSRL